MERLLKNNEKCTLVFAALHFKRHVQTNDSYSVRQYVRLIRMLGRGRIIALEYLDVRAKKNFCAGMCGCYSDPQLLRWNIWMLERGTIIALEYMDIRASRDYCAEMFGY